MAQERHLAWDGCLNIRDLGGHPTEDGGVTRFGAVVRADNVRRLTPAGWEALVTYGVSSVVDLRHEEELDADPPAELPVEHLHVPVFAGAGEEYWQRLVGLADAAPTTETAVQAVYESFLERFHARFAEATGAVATAPGGCVVVHCVEGKDRTGLVTGLLLRLAGVSIEHVAADYAISNSNLRPRHEPWIAEAPTEAERARRRRITATPARALAGALERLEREFGSVRTYLREGGMDDAALDAAVARLRG
jgi:protein-tyrosine phosphatase